MQRFECVKDTLIVRGTVRKTVMKLHIGVKRGNGAHLGVAACAICQSLQVLDRDAVSEVQGSSKTQSEIQ